jgi:hypothetical protein
MSEFIFLKKRQKISKNGKKNCRKIDRTGASRTVDRKLAVPEEKRGLPALAHKTPREVFFLA